MRRIALVCSLLAVGVGLAGCGSSHIATRHLDIATSSMEPTLHCAKPAAGCRGSAEDTVLVQVGKAVTRGDIVVYHTPRSARSDCGVGSLSVKRIIGLPGETISEDGHGFISVNGTRSADQYASAAARALDTAHFSQHWHVPAGDYFVIGDNRSESCDSRQWGGLPRDNIIGPVVKIVRG